jgi:NAD(P)-dependent dehydrogenase (short-subunit alcohol dehydrogenase family)
MERMSRVAGKVVLVTGAGSGIGRATAKLLAAEGATVVVTDINEPGGLETVQQIGAPNSGGGARFEEHDTAREEDWKRIIDAVMAREGKLDGLVNNAGIAGPFPSTFETETVEQWQRMLSINVQGVFLGCKHGVPAMKQSGGGSIVNTSSLAAFLGTPALSAYGASKGAVRQFTKTVAMDCARKGYKVRCNSVHPGIIMTPMGQGILPNDKARERALRTIPIGYFGAPEDIAYGILYLISDESRFVTGTELVIDGGMNAI